MDRREFRGHTIVYHARLLDAYEEDHQRWYHFPVARLGAVMLEMNRDAKQRSEPYTEWDVMPHLGGKPQVDPFAKDKAMFAKFGGWGFALEIDNDPD